MSQVLNKFVINIDNSVSLSDSKDKPGNADAQGSEPQQSTGSFFDSRSRSIGRNMTLRKGNACFNIVYLNAHSILPKLDELRILCASNSYDMICIVESWLSDDIDNMELFIPGFTIFRRDRDRHGGEIIVFVRNFLSCTVLPFEPPTSLHTTLEFLPLCL